MTSPMCERGCGQAIIGHMANAHDNLDDQPADILGFARRWYLFGGGSAEDILVEFGVTEHEYFRRLGAVLDTQSFDPGDDEIQAIRVIVAARQ